MLKKLSQLSTAAYVRASLFVQELKNDERGLSGVVVAVLLILVAVLAVVMLWDNLSQWITDLWNRIIDAGSDL